MMRAGLAYGPRRAMLAIAILLMQSLAIHCGGQGANSSLRDAGGVGAVAQGGATGDLAPSGTGAVDGASSLSLGSMECRGNADCTDTFAKYCIQPDGTVSTTGAPVVCNPVDKPGCASDIDCSADGGAMICDIDPVTCSPAVKTCIPGCASASDCKQGEDCVAHHCVTISCQRLEDCPTNFDCANGQCKRRSCANDAPCSGYCVVGSCYSRPGSCMQPVP